MTPGIHRIDPTAYHADALTPEPSLSSTLAKKLLWQSPRHAWHASPRLNPDHEPEVKDAFDIGSAAHTMLLSVGQRIHVVDAGDWKKKAAQAERDEAREAGATPLLTAQFERVEAMTGAVIRRLHDAGLGTVFADAERNEVAAFAPIDGVWCRCMVDHRGADGWLYDLKTTTDASPEAIRRSVESYGYHVQAQHYVETWRAAGGECRGMRFVFVEKAPPHEVAIVELVSDETEAGDWSVTAADMTASARRTWRACLDAGEWPGFPAQAMRVGARAFLDADWTNHRDVLAAMTPQRKDKPARAALERAAAWQSPQGI